MDSYDNEWIFEMEDDKDVRQSIPTDSDPDADVSTAEA